MIKLWNSQQGELLEEINEYLLLKLPSKVIQEAKALVGILDEFYGASRHPEYDLGGKVYILEKGTRNDSVEYKELLQAHNTTEEMTEYTDIITEETTCVVDVEKTYIWYTQLFILSSDYSIAIIYKDEAKA